MTPRWCDGALDIGLLGEVRVYQSVPRGWVWRYRADGGRDYPTAELAQRAAEVWIRRALKQAKRRCP